MTGKDLKRLQMKGTRSPTKLLIALFEWMCAFLFLSIIANMRREVSWSDGYYTIRAELEKAPIFTSFILCVVLVFTSNSVLHFLASAFSAWVSLGGELVIHMSLEQDWRESDERKAEEAKNKEKKNAKTSDPEEEEKEHEE